MIEQYISFEISKLAKENGFPQEPNRLRIPYYNYKGVFKGDVNDWLKAHLKKEDTSSVENVSAPTQSSLQKWLREEHDIFIEVQLDQTSTPKFAVEIFQYKSMGDFAQLKQKDWSLYRTYEEALEHGLLEALKLI